MPQTFDTVEKQVWHTLIKQFCMQIVQHRIVVLCHGSTVKHIVFYVVSIILLSLFAGVIGDIQLQLVVTDALPIHKFILTVPV